MAIAVSPMISEMNSKYLTNRVASAVAGEWNSPQKVWKSSTRIMWDEFVITEALADQVNVFGLNFESEGAIYDVQFQVRVPSSVGSHVDLLVYDGNTTSANFLCSLVKSVDTSVAGVVHHLDDFSVRRLFPKGSYIALKNAGATISDGEFEFSLIYTTD